MDKIPALVFPDKADAHEERLYLGVRHLLGFREWPPTSKAQYLEQEIRRAGSLGEVLKQTRLTIAQARRFLVPYRLLGDAKVDLPKGADFSMIGVALERTGIKKILQLEVDSESLKILSYNKKELNLLLNDLYGPKNRNGERDTDGKVVHDTRDISRLANVLKSEKASAVLRAGHGLEEAEIHVDTREESVRRLSWVTKALGVLVKKLSSGKDADSAKPLLQQYRRFDEAVKAFLSKVR